MTAGKPRLILGSASPRRLELLSQIGVAPDDVRPPDVDETPAPGEAPLAYCRRIVRAKAGAVRREPGEIVLVADTTVAVGRRILGKPADRNEAGAFLDLLSGRRHKVVTVVALAGEAGVRVKSVVSTVRMKRLSAAERAGYLATGDWEGKAGGYAIQGPAAAFIPWISGSHSAIVGLPLAETAALLGSVGYVTGETSS